MAYIRQYANGRWQAVVRRRGYPSKSESFTSRKDAVQWARSVETKVDGGTYSDRSLAERTTMAAAIDRYLEEVTPGKRSARSETQRLNQLRRIFGKHTLVTLQREEIAKYRDQRLRDRKAPGTVIKDLNTLSHVFEVAIKDWGLPLPGNPVKLVRRPKASRGRDRRITPEEYERLKAACKESRSPLLVPIVVLAVETAMRLGELLSLRWSDIDLDRRVAKLDMTKNGDSRVVPLSTLTALTPTAIRAVRRPPEP
ncbi:MAG: integrase [Proteobacteria bacterium]|nr:integrase [Pseudomonadota bacterium]